MKTALQIITNFQKTLVKEIASRDKYYAARTLKWKDSTGKGFQEETELLKELGNTILEEIKAQ